MASPSVDRSLDSLHPMFRAAFDAWLSNAAGILTQIDFRVTETRRTLARQEWLFAQGRSDPHKGAPTVTWTIDSLHRWGLAADIAMIRRATGEAVWEISSWQWLLKVAPPEPYGLRNLAPREYAHWELRYAAEAIAEAHVVGLTQT